MVATTTGSVASGNDFGLFTLGSISGTVYLDTNGNGSKVSTEPGAPSRTVYLDANNNGVLDPGEVTTTSSTNGSYSFTGLTVGSYYVRLLNIASTTLQTSTNPTAIGVTSGTAATGADFGTFILASIQGTVYDDTNGNATRNTGENGVTGVTVFIDANGNGVYDTGEVTATTDITGAYSFGGLPAATYKIRMSAPSTGYQTSTPLANLTTTSGAVMTGNDIGLFTYGTISGTVFVDDNGNGNMDTGEIGAIGARVYNDANSNNTFTTGEVSVLTNADGTWSLTGLKQGRTRSEWCCRRVKC